MKCCRPPSFSSAIMGRSWADHGQIMGRPWAIDSCRKILKISAFSDTVFFRKIMKICDFPTRLEQSVQLFLQTPLVCRFCQLLQQTIAIPNVFKLPECSDIPVSLLRFVLVSLHFLFFVLLFSFSAFHHFNMLLKISFKTLQ